MHLTKSAINLQHTLNSGQLFRYWKEGDSYRIVHGKNSFTASEQNNLVTFNNISKEGFSSLFRLDDNYKKILVELKSDETLKGAISAYPGLRLLRQDPWECTISFLCSSATNIPRIKRDLNNIAKTFGEEKDGIFLFPKLGEIDNLKKIAECGTGFRAKFIHQVNGIVTDSFFRSIRKKPYEDAKAALMELPGIGPKVADCILLFSLDHLSAFPIDVWSARVLNENYNSEKNHKRLAAFARNHFGDYAGYAQQFLYHWRRNQ